MSRKGAKNLTDSERRILISVIHDYEVCDLSDKKMIEILSQKLGRSIKESSYYTLKSEAKKNRPTPEEWLDNFVRFGLVDFYNKRIQEVKLVQKELIKLYAQEANKEEDPKDRNKQNKQLMNQLAKTINDSSKILSEMGMGPPYLARLYSLIPKKLLEGEDLEYMEKHFENMDKDKKLLWSGNSKLDDDNYDKNKTKKIDPSQAETAILPPIDNVMNPYTMGSKDNNNNKDEGRSSTAQQDAQRIF